MWQLLPLGGNSESYLFHSWSKDLVVCYSEPSNHPAKKMPHSILYMTHNTLDAFDMMLLDKASHLSHNKVLNECPTFRSCTKVCNICLYRIVMIMQIIWYTVQTCKVPGKKQTTHSLCSPLFLFVCPHHCRQNSFLALGISVKEGQNHSQKHRHYHICYLHFPLRR